MDVRFRTKKLAKVCSDRRLMTRTFGEPMASRLAARLQELEAAVVLEDIRSLPQARAHELTGGRDEQISLDLVHPKRLIITIGDEPTPRREDGGLDWTASTQAIVEEIVDTHD
jgi:proteic killer suppression protein